MIQLLTFLRRQALGLLALTFGLSGALHAQSPTIADWTYKTVNGAPLQLDFYRPGGEGPFPLVIWIHGGGWMNGSKAVPFSTISGLLDRGMAVASLNYRLTSQEATFGAGNVTFPAQIDDVQDAILFLRANAPLLEIDAARVGTWGTSAGGHLATLAGLKGDANDPRGDTSVQAIGDGYGPTDLFTMDSDALQNGCMTFLTHDDPDSAESILVGFDGPGEGIGVLRDNPQLPEYQLVLDANPISFLSPLDPPILALHGETDCVVSIGQSFRLRDAYLAAGLEIELLTHPGGHTLPAEFREDFWDFFAQELCGSSAPPEVTTLFSEDFTRSPRAWLDPQTVPADFDNESPASGALEWGACNLGTSTGTIPHGIGLDPNAVVSVDGGALFLNGGALAEGSRAYARLDEPLDLSERGSALLTFSRANQIGGIRYRLLLRAESAWWLSEELTSPVVFNATQAQSLEHDFATLDWFGVDTATGAGADMDEVDPGGETGALVRLGPGAPNFATVEGIGVEMGQGNDLTRALAVERLELRTAVTELGAASCFGDGTGTACPCGNDDAQNPSHGGCLNQNGTGARLSVRGSRSLSEDNLLFDVEGANPLTFGVLLSGDNLLGGGLGVLGSPLANGLRCIGGAATRHGSRSLNAEGANENSWNANLQLNGFAAGQTRHFQARYRADPLLGPCGFDQNTSQAISVTFCP